MAGMVLPPEKPDTAARRKPVAPAPSSPDEPKIVEKVTTVPDSGPISRARGSTVTVPDYPERKTR
jgi:hypothetical protein